MKPPGRRRWKRVARRVLAGLLICIVTVYIVERIRGRRALEQAIADYEADGESLDVSRFLTKAPPPAENFGATPLLDGIMCGEDVEMPQRAGYKRKRVRLNNLVSGRFEWGEPVEFYAPQGKSPSPKKMDKSAK